MKNKVILITGANKGIGETLSLEFSKIGANVVLLGRNEESLDGVYDEIIANNVIHINRILKVLDHALESTKNMEAKVGRAKFLDTKGVGITDPGAFSTTLILKEFFKEFVNEKNN